MRFLRSLLALALLAHAALLPAAALAQTDCDDLAQQAQFQQQQVDQERSEAQQLLTQVVPLVAVAQAELLAEAAQGALPGIDPDVAAVFGSIVAQVGAQVAAWQAGHEQAASDAYLRDLLNQLASWQGQFAATSPVQSSVSSMVQLSTTFTELEQLVSQAQGDLALLDSFQRQLQACQAQAAAPTPVPSPPPADQGAPEESGGGGALCEVGGASGTSASQCFQLESDAAYAVWAACTEQYFAAEQEAFRTGGDPPANTCDPAWRAALDAIQQRWGGSPPSP